MAVDDVYLLSLKALLNGQQVVNTFAFRRLVAAEPTATQFGVLATAIKDGLRQDQVNDLTYQDWRALKVRGSGVTYSTTAPFRTSTVAYAGPFTGTLTGASTLSPDVNQAATVLSISTALAGRRHKGRVFIAGMYATAHGDDSLLSTAFISAVVLHAIGALDDYIVGGTDTTWRLGVWSDRTAMNVALSNTWPRTRISMGTPDPDSAFSDAEGLDVRQYIGNQRGRRPGI